MRLEIATNFPEVQRRLDGLREQVGQQALARAMNRTVDAAKTQVRREIVREFNVTSEEVNKTLRIVRASFSRGAFQLTAMLESRWERGRSLNLIRFVERSVSITQARKRMKAGEGGTYTLRGAQRSKTLELRFKVRRSGPQKVIPGAFIGNKGRTVFIREGKGRLPIKAVQTIAIPQMFNTKRINERVLGKIASDFPRIFEAEVRFFTRRFEGKA